MWGKDAEGYGSMPLEVTAYKCQYCNQISLDHSFIERHEKMCSYNKERERHYCYKCVHSERDYWIDFDKKNRMIKHYFWRCKIKANHNDLLDYCDGYERSEDAGIQKVLDEEKR